MSPRAARAGRGSNVLAFTLIEVLVSVAIVAGMGLLVLPGLMNWSSTASDESVVDQLQASVDSARAIAIEEGVPVTVAVRQGASGEVIVAQWKVAPAFRDRPEEAGSEEPKSRTRLLLRLPSGFHLQLPLETSETEAGSEAVARRAPERSVNRAEDQSEGEPKPTWLVLPDGSVESSTPCELEAPDGRRGRVQISALAGVVRCEKLTLPSTEDAPDPEPADATPAANKGPAAQPAAPEALPPEAP